MNTSPCHIIKTFSNFIQFVKFKTNMFITNYIIGERFFRFFAIFIRSIFAINFFTSLCILWNFINNVIIPINSFIIMFNFQVANVFSIILFNVFSAILFIVFFVIFFNAFSVILVNVFYSIFFNIFNVCPITLFNVFSDNTFEVISSLLCKLMSIILSSKFVFCQRHIKWFPDLLQNALNSMSECHFFHLCPAILAELVSMQHVCILF